MMPYFGVPTTMNVSHLSAVPVGTSTLAVTTEQHAYVALSMNGVLLDAQIVGQSGTVTLSFSPFSNIGSADLVVTKQFREPYFGTVSVITTNAPFVICPNYFADDSFGNNNGLVDYGEVIHLDVDLQNLGSVNANNVSVKLSTNNQYITITDSLDFTSFVNANQTANISNAFTFVVELSSMALFEVCILLVDCYSHVLVLFPRSGIIVGSVGNLWTGCLKGWSGIYGFILQVGRHASPRSYLISTFVDPTLASSTESMITCYS